MSKLERIAWLAERAYQWPPSRLSAIVQQIEKIAKEPKR